MLIKCFLSDYSPALIFVTVTLMFLKRERTGNVFYYSFQGVPDRFHDRFRLFETFLWSEKRYKTLNAQERWTVWNVHIVQDKRSGMFAKSYLRDGHGTFTLQKRKNYFLSIRVRRPVQFCSIIWKGILRKLKLQIVLWKTNA